MINKKHINLFTNEKWWTKSRQLWSDLFLLDRYLSFMSTPVNDNKSINRKLLVKAVRTRHQRTPLGKFDIAYITIWTYWREE